MKKILIICILILSFALPCFAFQDADIFDYFGPFQYDGKPLDKMTLAVYTNQDMDSAGAKFFDDKFISFGMPLALADIRAELYMPNGSSSQIMEISTVVPLIFASVQGGYVTEIGASGTPYQEVNIDLIFSNILFNWGIGIAQDIGSTPQTMPKLKISKQMDVGFAKIEAKAAYIKYDSTDDEMDLIVKARFNALPVYAGFNTGSFLGTSVTQVILGAMFNL